MTGTTGEEAQSLVGSEYEAPSGTAANASVHRYATLQADTVPYLSVSVHSQPGASHAPTGCVSAQMVACTSPAVMGPHPVSGP